MATVSQLLSADDFGVAGSATFPALVQQAASSSPTVRGLAFDAATDEAAQAIIDATLYGSGNLTANVRWYADSASSGDVVIGASLMAYTPNTDSGDIEADAWATENTATDSHLGTTGQRLHSVDITISNLDSLAAGDFALLRIRRLGLTDAADTMTGDLVIVAVEISFSDT